MLLTCTVFRRCAQCPMRTEHDLCDLHIWLMCATCHQPLLFSSGRGARCLDISDTSATSTTLPAVIPCVPSSDAEGGSATVRRSEFNPLKSMFGAPVATATQQCKRPDDELAAHQSQRTSENPTSFIWRLEHGTGDKKEHEGGGYREG